MCLCFWFWLTCCGYGCESVNGNGVRGIWNGTENENESETCKGKINKLVTVLVFDTTRCPILCLAIRLFPFILILCCSKDKYIISNMTMCNQTNPSPAATASLAETVAVVGVVASVPTLVTPIIGVKLASAGTPSALPGHACWQLHTNTGTTQDPVEKNGVSKRDHNLFQFLLQSSFRL